MVDFSKLFSNPQTQLALQMLANSGYSRQPIGLGQRMGMAGLGFSQYQDERERQGLINRLREKQITSLEENLKEQKRYRQIVKQYSELYGISEEEAEALVGKKIGPPPPSDNIGGSNPNDINIRMPGPLPGLGGQPSPLDARMGAPAGGTPTPGLGAQSPQGLGSGGLNLAKVLPNHNQLFNAYPNLGKTEVSDPMEQKRRMLAMLALNRPGGADVGALAQLEGIGGQAKGPDKNLVLSCASGDMAACRSANMTPESAMQWITLSRNPSTSININTADKQLGVNASKYAKTAPSGRLVHPPASYSATQAEAEGYALMSTDKQKQFETISDLRGITGTLEGLAEKIFTGESGLYNRLVEAGRMGSEFYKGTPEYALYGDLSDAYLAAIARQYEKGTLNEGDVKRAKGALPRMFPIPDTREIMKQKFATQREIWDKIQYNEKMGIDYRTSNKKTETPRYNSEQCEMIGNQKYCRSMDRPQDWIKVDE